MGADLDPGFYTITHALVLILLVCLGTAWLASSHPEQREWRLRRLIFYIAGATPSLIFLVFVITTS